MCLGLVLTGLLLYLLQKPLDSVLESQYQGWEQFAGITLGVPIALLTGYGCRNFVKFLVMLITAFVGAASAWRWGSSLLECNDVESELLENRVFNVAVWVGIGLLGVVAQYFWQPRGAVKTGVAREEHGQA
eukprot:symbB.v1.2.004018.t1/scaffold227.1/size261201/4